MIEVAHLLPLARVFVGAAVALWGFSNLLTGIGTRDTGQWARGIILGAAGATIYWSAGA